MASLNPPDLSGQEPALSSGHPGSLSGSEPMLGGIRRPAADARRIQILLDTTSPAERRRLIDAIREYGQAGVYAAELAGVIPARARHRAGNWHGTLTPGQRQRAVEALAELGSYESIPALLDLLADSTYRDVQRAAGRALDAICTRLDPADPRTAQTLDRLVRALRDLPLSGRNVVVGILAAAPPDLALRPLLAHGLAAPEIPARRDAIRTLGLLGDKRATRRLDMALSDLSATVRASAAWALGRLDAPVAVPPLIEATADPDDVVRAAAVEALGAQTARLDPLDPRFREALNALAAALGDDEMSVRLAALDALAAIDQPEARIALHTLRHRGASMR